MSLRVIELVVVLFIKSGKVYTGGIVDKGVGKVDSLVAVEFPLP